MKRYAEVIGDPVSHSKSPSIHNFWLGELGIDAEYRLHRVAVGEVGAYLDARRADPLWRGCNITIPHKETAYRLVVDEGFGTLAPGEGDFGAINTIGRDDSGALIGRNTDVDGVTGPIRTYIEERFEGRSPPALHIAVVGAGGASRAALWGLKSLLPNARFTVLARREEQAQALLDSMKLLGNIAPIADASLENVDILMNASPLGMTGKPPLKLSPGAMNADGLVFDMVYAPLETDLLASARSLGLTAVDGLQMLVGQAAGAFHQFFGRHVPRALVAEVHKRLAGQ
jgi:shikimate dehydrogenase